MKSVFDVIGQDTAPISVPMWNAASNVTKADINRLNVPIPNPTCDVFGVTKGDIVLKIAPILGSYSHSSGEEEEECSVLAVTCSDTSHPNVLVAEEEEESAVLSVIE